MCGILAITLAITLHCHLPLGLGLEPLYVQQQRQRQVGLPLCELSAFAVHTHLNRLLLDVLRRNVTSKIAAIQGRS